MPPPAVAADFEKLPEHEPTVVPPPATASDRFNVANLEHQESVDRAEAHDPEQLHPLKDPNRPTNAHMFFNIYFMMTGLHGIHVFVGIIMLSWLLVLSLKGRFGPEYFTPVDLGGLYWHIVDLIWIFLFPLFYLI